MKKIIATDKAPAAIGPYSQAVEVNGLIFTSGVIPIVPATGELVQGGIEEQADQAHRQSGSTDRGIRCPGGRHHQDRCLYKKYGRLWQSQRDLLQVFQDGLSGPLLRRSGKTAEECIDRD